MNPLQPEPAKAASSSSKAKKNLSKAIQLSSSSSSVVDGTKRYPAQVAVSKRTVKKFVQRVSVDAERRLEERQLHHVRNSHPFMMGEEEEMQEDYEWQVRGRG